MSFSISNKRIDGEALKRAMHHAEAGAFACFEGWIRNHNEGKQVARLEYEVYAALAQSEGQKILAEAVEQFGLLDATAVHRAGTLEIGDCAVWVGVIAPHRDEAFKACRFIIDAIKHRLPIWKKEFYADGSHDWVNCQHHHARDIKPADQYSRQMLLPEIGVAGQEKLGAAKILIVGAGGLGSSAAMALAAAGIGTIGIVEHDRLEASNLHRQVLYSAADIGKSKAQLAAARLQALNPTIKIVTHETKLTAANAEILLRDYDIVLDCTDNFPTKYLLNDAAILFDKTLIQASIYRFEGQLLKISRATAGCLRCLWPEPPDAGSIGTCAEIGVLGTVPMLFGTLQANEAIKHSLGIGQRDNQFMTFDLLSLSAQNLTRTKRYDCPLCGTNPTITAITDEHKNLRYAPQPTDTIATLRQKFKLLDVREDDERKQRPVASDYQIPFTTFDENAAAILRDAPLLVICEKGQRSLTIALKLRQAGWTQVYSLENGLQGLAQTVTGAVAA